MGERIGLIAGAGESPLLALEEAARLGLECVVAGIRGEAQADLKTRAVAFEWVGLTELDKVVSFFKAHSVRRAVMAGAIDPKAVLQPKETMDDALFQLIAQIRDKTPSRLIQSLIDYLAAQGIAVVDPSFLLQPYFCPPGLLGSAPPTPAILEDIEFGWERVRRLADEDIGQTLAVKDRAVVAVESMEGTNETIERAGRLAGAGLVVIKVARTRQDPRIDIPAVGLETIRSLIRARAAALCFEAGRMPFFQKDESLALADAANLIILAKRS
ncbi:MAG: UDP-2,3-diacylglucosamine diphosphatase LpxI [Acidobacteriota bacterium]|nr:UDP-2,3-diacylglucosamine diphosphatase LpxI [Acidobacteriota bacterium]